MTSKKDQLLRKLSGGLTDDEYAKQEEELLCPYCGAKDDWDNPGEEHDYLTGTANERYLSPDRANLEALVTSRSADLRGYKCWSCGKKWWQVAVEMTYTLLFDKRPTDKMMLEPLSDRLAREEREAE